MLTSPEKKATDKPEMFDTLGIYRRLKRARASEPVAREIAMAMGEIVQSQLATKEDLLVVRRDFQDVKQELKLEISASRMETLRWMMGMMVAQLALLVSILKIL
ncbi:MAG TPA: hypothetical protein PKE49_17965 [Leptospiraceae bacterium]|nr:hypothetical protein [Leptospirales bacterium]HMW58605.1 hypothetical protein [Leptospiraceae bacterium]HMX58418.1 hypothetical protein [Leptospiraceae bacterium]HNE23138.1 hypothetical protein [Leptospiraceae bacterium]HNJ06067.1 hypothetical protein [Leptospiraceae bacterium]